jgi:hypothetical protein
VRKRKSKTGGRSLVGASTTGPTPENVTKAENWESANPNRYEPDSAQDGRCTRHSKRKPRAFKSVMGISREHERGARKAIVKGAVRPVFSSAFVQ